MQLDPKDTNLTLKLSALYEYDARGLRFTDRAHMTEAVATLRKIEPEISQLGRINTLAEALLFSRQFAAVKSLSERDDRNVSWSYRVAALAMTNGVEAARNSFDRAQSTEQRAFVFKNAGAFLVLLQEYATAAALLREAAKDENDVQATEVDLLAPTLRRQETHFSENAPVALGQLLIYALLDPEDEESWKKLYVPEWRGMRLKSERQALLTILRGWRSMAGQILGWKSIADVAVSNGAFVAEGSDGTGYRVRMADPAGNGAMKTIVWIVKRGADYQVLGLATNWANAGGEALKEARSGDLEGASQWLAGGRQDQPPPASADPLAGTAFARLWPAPKGSAEQVAVAAASLAARGLPYEDARPMLVEAQKEASGAYRDGIDLAILESYAVRGEFAIGLPEAVRLHAAYPDSDRGFSGLLEAYIDSGQMDAAAHLAEERLAKDPKSASGLRARSRVLLERRQYGDAGAAIREVTRTAKVTATDWNDLAWYALFTDSVDADVLEAANTATRLTQNRNASLIQTLGCVQALRGDTAAAHKSLYQYLDLAGDTDDAARLLHGLIMEQVGVTESAREDYQRLARPKKREATSSYALGQRRLASMAAR
jgi:Tfp pilus assembly protein PilF